MKDEDKEMEYKLEQLLAQFGYTNIIDASNKDIETQLGWDYLTWKKVKYYFTTRGIFQEVDHHKSSKRNMILLTVSQFNDIQLIESELRMCRANIDNVLTPVRHYSHSREIECFPYDPSLWAIKTTIKYNAQTETPEVKSKPSDLITAGLTPKPAGNRHDRILYSKTLTFRDGSTKDFYVTPSGYLTKDGKHKFNLISEIEAYWEVNWRKKLTRYDQQYGLGRKRIEKWNSEANEYQKFWMDEATRVVYDDYGDPLEVYPTKKEIRASLVKVVWKEYVADKLKAKVERWKESNEAAAEENRRCKQAAKYRDEQRKQHQKEFRAELRIENKIRGYQRY